MVTLGISYNRPRERRRLGKCEFTTNTNTCYCVSRLSDDTDRVLVTNKINHSVSCHLHTAQLGDRTVCCCVVATCFFGQQQRSMSTRRGRPLLLSVLLSVFLVRCGNTETDTSAELDEEGDSAPYAVAVELAGGGLCAGSLVAARTVLTSASCARGRPARALTAGGTRRVRRAVTARGADETVSDELAGGWGGALLDLAVLVLDKSPGPPARPILMAVDPAQCESPHTACIVAGSLAAPGERRMSLRVAEATVAEGGTCSSRARFWASVRDRALCLTGPKLCAVSIHQRRCC